MPLPGIESVSNMMFYASRRRRELSNDFPCSDVAMGKLSIIAINCDLTYHLNPLAKVLHCNKSWPIHICYSYGRNSLPSRSICILTITVVSAMAFARRVMIKQNQLMTHQILIRCKTRKVRVNKMDRSTQEVPFFHSRAQKRLEAARSGKGANLLVSPLGWLRQAVSCHGAAT